MFDSNGTNEFQGAFPGQEEAEGCATTCGMISISGSKAGGTVPESFRRKLDESKGVRK
jgi:hypothetical protein